MNEIMNQLNLIPALTGVIPGQSANGNGSQGALAGSGAGLFNDLVGQQLAAAAKALPGNQPGAVAATSAPVFGSPVSGSPVNGSPVSGSPVSGSPVDELPGGASALLRVTAGAAADQSLLENPELNIPAASAAEISPAQAQAPAQAPALNPALNPVDDDSVISAAGEKNQDSAAALPEISPGAGTSETSDGNIIIAQLPAEASTSAALSPGKAGAAVAIPAAGAAARTQLGEAIAPASEAAAAAPAAPAAGGPAAGGNVAAQGANQSANQGANKILKAEGDNQSRLQTAAKGSAETPGNFTGNAVSSDNFDGQGERGNPHHGARNNGHGGGNGASGSSTGSSAGTPTGTPTGKGIKTSVGAGQAGLNLVTELPAAGRSFSPLASQLTPLAALENSMALNAGLVLPFDSGAAVDPMTGMQTSQSAQSLAAGLQALQAGTSISTISGAAPGATGLAHAPNFVAHQVGLHITKAIAGGQNEFTIRLNPPELGRVEVRLEFATDGSVRAALSAEKPETLNLLQRDASALERALNDAGVKTDSGSLNFSLQQGAEESQRDGADNAGDQAAAGQDVAGDYPPDGETEISEQVIQQMIADGTVDIRV